MPDIVDDVFGLLLEGGTLGVAPVPLLLEFPSEFRKVGTLAVDFCDGETEGTAGGTALLAVLLSFDFDGALALLLVVWLLAEFDSPCSFIVFSTMLCNARPSP